MTDDIDVDQLSQEQILAALIDKEISDGAKSFGQKEREYEEVLDS